MKQIAVLRPAPDPVLEHRAEVLRERIYGTITLIAVMIGLGGHDVTATHALLTVIGTALSLWAAGLVATRLSRHIVLGDVPEQIGGVRHHLRQHRALLLVALLPTASLSLAAAGIISMHGAVLIAMIGLHLPLLAWAYRAARFSRTRWLSPLAAALLVIVSIVAVTSFKAYAAHL